MNYHKIFQKTCVWLVIQIYFLLNEIFLNVNYYDDFNWPFEVWIDFYVFYLWI